MEHDRIRKEGFHLDGNQVFLAGTQILRHIQQIGCPAFQDGRGLSVDPDFPGRIQGVQMQECLGERPDLDPGAKIVILPRLGGTAMGGRQRNRLPGCIVIASFLPASHGRDLLEIFIEDQFAPIRGCRLIGMPDEIIEGDSLHGSLPDHGQPAYSLFQGQFPQGFATLGKEQDSIGDVTIKFKIRDGWNRNLGRSTVRMG